ncbi:DUF2628 domain-containing protein [Neorhizobium galegae]|uniref:DUF2628 domain-containing protein n=1 Tax=Neorhizobium galegae bv. officinalis TaxID=323656 RepID=A0A0T7GUR1_NEOGA|nr:DUF2628 domain-containing protein [Neorhizobium galegae]CDZ50966.1 Hypothetical protein NGAL_HAMBI1189_37300 [Neorhizobium galegae bv. officinalis]
MRSYLVLTPPNDPRSGPKRDFQSTLVLRDGFSWLALLFPWIWLFWHRLWVAGIVVLLVQIGSGVLMQVPGFWTAGLLLGFATSLLTALEGRHYRSEALIRRGWTLETVIAATDLRTAEEIYFSRLPQPQQQPMPVSAEWAKQAKPPAAGWQAPHMGLFEHGGR